MLPFTAQRRLFRFNACERHVKFNFTPKSRDNDAKLSTTNWSAGTVTPLWSCQAGDPNKVQLARFMIIPCYAQIIFRQFHIRSATGARTAKSSEREFITPNVNNKEDKSLYSRPPQNHPLAHLFGRSLGLWIIGDMCTGYLHHSRAKSNWNLFEIRYLYVAFLPISRQEVNLILGFVKLSERPSSLPSI